MLPVSVGLLIVSDDSAQVSILLHRKKGSISGSCLPGVDIRVFKLSCLKCLFRGIITLSYSLSFLSKIFILMDSCHEVLSPEGILRGYFFSSLGSMGWGRGSSPLPGGGSKGDITCRELKH